MFINPDDRRAGIRQQRMTRAQIEQQLASQVARRRSMSRFAPLGQSRFVRASRPFRSVAGIRAFAGGAPRRPGGLAQFLQDRGPGRSPDARHYIEPPVAEIPAVPEAELPSMSLSGEPRIGLSQPFGIEFIRDLGGNTPLQPALTQEIRQQLISSPPVPAAGLDVLTGLVPLGGGSWYDPNTGILHGPSGPGRVRMF